MLDPNRDALEGVLARELGQSVRLEIVTPEATPIEPADTIGDGASHSESDEDEGVEAIERNPLVRKAMELFDAEIIEIKSKSPTEQRR